jgi:hypothetical protein
LHGTRLGIDESLDNVIKPLSSLARAITTEKILHAFNNCCNVFSPLPDKLKNLGERATEQAIESLEDEGEEEWHVKPHGAGI